MILWQVFLKGKEMRNKYRVQECPLILLLNSKGREFARLNFFDHKLLKELVSSLINDFSMIC